MPTQAERRTATRQLLLGASAGVLDERGLNGFTTAAVTERAGASNGALFRHFPTRLELLAATVEHVLVRLRDDYDRTFAGLEPAPEVTTMLELLWAAMSDPQFAAVLEVYTQSRTDASVLAAIHPIVTDHGEYVRRLTERVATALAGDGPGSEETVERIAAIGDLAILAMQGLVVGHMAGASTGFEHDLLPALTRLVHREIR